MDTSTFLKMFGGANVDIALFELHCRLRGKLNEPRGTFLIAWEAVLLLNSDGFAFLLEQRYSLEEYAAALEKLGLPEARPIFDRVTALLPPEVRDQKEPFWKYSTPILHDQVMEELSNFYDVSADVEKIAVKFITEHLDDFSRYAIS